MTKDEGADAKRDAKTDAKRGDTPQRETMTAEAAALLDELAAEAAAKEAAGDAGDDVEAPAQADPNSEAAMASEAANAAYAGAAPAEEQNALAEERDELKRRLAYALADVENIRKRAERDRRDAEAYGGTKLARDLLAVHDSLEKALAHVDDAQREAAASLVEGVELTQRELLKAFEKNKVELVRPEKGDRFDPNLHQAMFEAPVPGAENGTVIEVMQAGFTIAGRLLRAAMVGVAKGG